MKMYKQLVYVLVLRPCTIPALIHSGLDCNDKNGPMLHNETPEEENTHYYQ